MTNQTCQMTISKPKYPTIPDSGTTIYDKCGKPAKYRVPNPKMGVEYVCGIHANQLNKMYKRIHQNFWCMPIEEVVK